MWKPEASGLYIPTAARIRDRLRPRPRMGAGVGGWLDWELVDRRGRVVDGGQQHNLFLNQGLDAIGASALASASWFTHAAVGTASVEPEATDTSLGSELARTATIVTSSDFVRTTPGAYSMFKEWEFDFAQANGNLTEWGIARASSGKLVAKELFRDGLGEPVTIVKTSDYKLRLKYTFEVTLAPVVLTPFSVNITGIGVVNGDMMWIGGNSADYDLTTFGMVAAGSVGFCPPGPLATPLLSYTDTVSVISAGTRSSAAYVGGSYTRSTTVNFTTAQGNMENIATFALRRAAGNGASFALNIDEADRFTKDNQHTLTITDFLTVTWARA